MDKHEIEYNNFLHEFFENKLYNDKIITEFLESLKFEDMSWKNEEIPRYGLTNNDYNEDYWCLWFGDDKIKDTETDYLYLKNSALCYYKNDDIIFTYESIDIYEILSIIKSNHKIYL